MGRQYKLIECAYSDELSAVVSRHLADGWDCWGNPFAQEAEYDGNVRDIHYCQAVVRTTEPGEPAGYAVGSPELEHARANHEPCTCLEQAGDDPDCPAHSTRRIP
jgi:hypothetical protein